jgi:SAM-dependent methyltransferase
MTPATDRRAWERAEIERSRRAARSPAPPAPAAEEREIRRYLNPPADTVYPLEFAFERLGDVRGRTVLDLGCGAGATTLVLARRGARVVGVDISTSLLDLARQRLERDGRRARLIAASAHDLPLASGSVDVVLGVSVLHHLDLDAASRELHRVLKPGGRAVFKEPVRDSAIVRRLRGWIPYQRDPVSPFERPLTTSDLRTFGARFRSAAWRAFELPFVRLAHVSRAGSAVMSAAYRVDGALLHRLPRLMPLCAVRVVWVSK